jgi:hypothetical protein
MFSVIDDATYDDYVSKATYTSSTDASPTGSSYVANNHNLFQ